MVFGGPWETDKRPYLGRIFWRNTDRSSRSRALRVVPGIACIKNFRARVRRDRFLVLTNGVEKHVLVVIWPYFFFCRAYRDRERNHRHERHAGIRWLSCTPPGERSAGNDEHSRGQTSEATTPVGGHHSVGAMAFARSHSRSSMSMTESSLSSQLSRRQSSIDSWKQTASNLRRWFAEYEEKSIRALISRQDGKSNEQILSVWKLRKTAGNWRSLILTSEAIYDATLGHRSCKRRCHLATVRAITACTASGQFLIHIDETYDTLYVDRKKQAAVIEGIVQAAARFRAVDVPHMKE